MALVNQEIEQLILPTFKHIAVTDRLINRFSTIPDVLTIILTCSCARGKGKDDIDYAILVEPGSPLTRINEIIDQWQIWARQDEVFRDFRNQGPFFRIDVTVTDAQFRPQPYYLSEGPDHLERDIGNTFIYAKPLWERRNHFSELRGNWQPYYDETMALERRRQGIADAGECILSIREDWIRGNHFWAYRRLLKAVEYFIHALFIDRRIYPIAYDKWLQEQFAELLGIPDLYGQITNILSVGDIREPDMIDKGQHLLGLIEEYLEW